MMLSNKKTKVKKIPEWIFIVASIAALAVILPLITILSLLFSPSIEPFTITGQLAKTTEIISDPLITRASDNFFKLSSPIFSSEDPIYGDKQSQVKIVVFSDFKCEYCKNHLDLLKKEVDQRQGKVCLTWKDYPNEDKNSASYRAALAGRCAQRQDKFWNFSNIIYKQLLSIDESTELSDNALANWAEDAGLDPIAFKDCLADGEADNLVQLNIEEAKALDVIGVPFMYVDNQEFIGEISQDDLDKAIDSELNK